MLNVVKMDNVCAV